MGGVKLFFDDTMKNMAVWEAIGFVFNTQNLD